jgi:mannosyltransferase OCH1-like enzyme
MNGNNYRAITFFLCITALSPSLRAVYEPRHNTQQASIDLSKSKIQTLVIQNKTSQPQELRIEFVEQHADCSLNNIDCTVLIPPNKSQTCNQSLIRASANAYIFINKISATTSALAFEFVENNHAATILRCKPYSTSNTGYYATVEDIDFTKDLTTNIGNNSLNRLLSPNNNFAKYVLAPITPKALLSCLQTLYNKNRLNNITPRAIASIPHIIHHIWLGSPFPEGYRSWRQSWIDKHPGWVYILWTDNKTNYQEGTFVANEEALATCLASNAFTGKTLVFDIKNFAPINITLVSAAKNYGEKSDLLRYEVLYRYGGVYTDTDLECFEPFDILHQTYDFYTGLAPLNLKFQVANGLIGSTPKHPILDYCIKHAASSETFSYLNKIFYNGTSIVAATGPGLFTKAIFYSANTNPELRNIVFPASYFYAHRSEMLQYAQEHDDFPPHLFVKLPPTFKMPLQTFATHYWEQKWKPPENKPVSAVVHAKA